MENKDFLDEWFAGLDESKQFEIITEYLENNRYYDDIPHHISEVFERVLSLEPMEAFKMGQKFYDLDIVNNDCYYTWNGSDDIEIYASMGEWLECHKNDYNVADLIDCTTYEGEYEEWLEEEHPELFEEEEDCD